MDTVRPGSGEEATDTSENHYLQNSTKTVWKSTGVVKSAWLRSDNGVAAWTVYNSIDPDFRSGDLILNLSVSPAAPSTQLKVTTEHSNLNIRKGPGTDQPIIGKAAHHSHVTLLSMYNDEWALIRSAAGEEGYCSRKYLTEI